MGNAARPDGLPRAAGTAGPALPAQTFRPNSSPVLPGKRHVFSVRSSYGTASRRSRWEPSARLTCFSCEISHPLKDTRGSWALAQTRNRKKPCAVGINVPGTRSGFRTVGGRGLCSRVTLTPFDTAPSRWNRVAMQSVQEGACPWAWPGQGCCRHSQAGRKGPRRFAEPQSSPPTRSHASISAFTRGRRRGTGQTEKGN